MAKKAKDFDQINTGRVSGAIEKAIGKTGVQTTASQEEQQARAAALRTQGRKGCKAVRINMAFSPDNYNFIRQLARASGLTLTAYCNRIVTAYRLEHPELEEAARAFNAFAESVAPAPDPDLEPDEIPTATKGN